MVIDWDLVGSIQASIFLFDSLNAQFYYRQIMIKMYYTCASSVISQKRSREIWVWISTKEQWQLHFSTNHENCWLRKNQRIPIGRPFFKWKLSINALMEEVKPIGIEEWGIKYKDFKININLWLLWTISIPTQRSRSIIFLLKSPRQVKWSAWALDGRIQAHSYGEIWFRKAICNIWQHLWQFRQVTLWKQRKNEHTKKSVLGLRLEFPGKKRKTAVTFCLKLRCSTDLT